MFFRHPRIYGERALFFCGEIMTQKPATAGPAAAAAAAAMHRACYNQLSTTLQRYRAQQQQATPCACDRSALYCVEMLWKAREIRHPSHLLVPITSRLLFLFCFVRHKTQTQPHTTAAVQRARYNQQPYRAQQQQATPCACRQRHARVTDTRCTDTRAVLCRVVLSNLRSVTHHIHLTLYRNYVLLQKLHVACMHVAAHPCTWLPSQRRCSSSDNTTTSAV